MKQSKRNPVAALGAAATLIILQFAIRRCMKKYGG